MAVEIKNVAIIGCGWLGLSLSQMLIEDGYSVKGSTRSVSKQQDLKAAGIEAYLLDIYDDKKVIDKKLGEVDAVIINIPPGRRTESVETLYPKGIMRLLESCSGLADAYVVFVSSTGVYPNTQSLVDETSATSSERSSGKALIVAEGVIREHCPRHVILRLSGLVGPKREPGRWFAGKSDIPGGDTPVNMVHLSDCLNIIQLMLQRQPSKEVYNVSAPAHPVKREFYKAQSAKIEVDAPSFLDGVVPHKVVNPEKLIKDYDYQYQYPDPLEF